ncbi:MAG: hypothetical protein IJ291_05840 [Lachnospiraceae bacterium]|nr:hypothetical protein [Lachnospiraceae bacterium]
MSVNGITTGVDAGYSAYTTGKTTTKTTNETNTAITEKAAVYEPSAAASAYSATGKKVANPELVSYLQSENQARCDQLQQIVQKLIVGQGNAIAASDDMWKFLASGNFTVDAETKAQAQADIAEDGYWGVEATSDRIIDFAVAIAGDDKEKLEEMRNAFEKGFQQATKTWGGKLPDISQRTYDAVQKKFDALTAPEATAEAQA